MVAPPFRVIYEDNHLLAVDKPAGLVTMGAPAGVPNLLAEAKAYVKQKYDKPGNVYLGVVSRLDARATGLVLLARTSKAAARLTRQVRDRSVEKTYWAVVEGRIRPESATCRDWVVKDERHRRMHIAAGPSDGAKDAVLSYRLVRPLEAGSLVEVRLETGRKHQIRLQLAHRGFPITGDRKYGARRDFAGGIALHAVRLALAHPVGGRRLELAAAIPDAWRILGVTAVDGPLL